MLYSSTGAYASTMEGVLLNALGGQGAKPRVPRPPMNLVDLNACALHLQVNSIERSTFKHYAGRWSYKRNRDRATTRRDQGGKSTGHDNVADNSNGGSVHAGVGRPGLPNMTEHNGGHSTAPLTNELRTATHRYHCL